MQAITNPNNIPSHIADSLCRQLITFQQAVEALACPTPNDVNMQAKMISNVIKIKKYNAIDHVATAMKKFITFLGKEDKELAKAVTEKYRQYVGSDEIILPPDSNEAITPAHASQETYLLDPPPFTAEENRKLAFHMLDVNSAHKEPTYTVNGKIYDRQWLEYNLLQYTLPANERKFISDPARYRLLVDHNETKRLINKFYGWTPNSPRG